jgi:hypothetical protein
MTRRQTLSSSPMMVSCLAWASKFSPNQGKLGQRIGSCQQANEYSTVFADMRNLPTSPASQQKSGQSIHLDYDAKILLQFIELVSIHNFESIVINLGFRACRALLPLLIQLDCARLRHAVRQQLYKSASGKGEAWELFKFGAVRDDWEMGRQGLKRMSQDQVIHLLASCPTFIGILTTLPAEWQFALSSTIMASSFDSRQLAMDWSQQASKFHRPGSLADQAMAL